MDKSEDFGFEQYYQPIIKLGENEISHYEVLSRTRLNGWGKSIFELIKEYEEEGKIYYFDMKNVEIVVDKIKDKTFGEDRPFAVNLSADTVQSELLIPSLNALYRKMKGENDRLIFEITETKPIDNYELVNEFIRIVNSNGGRVSMDDFGTGHANEKSVGLLNINSLKIDGDYVDHLVTDISSQKFIQKAVQIANIKGIKTIAERVECIEQMEILKDLGVDMVQGYYVGMPNLVPAPQRAIDYIMNQQTNLNLDWDY